MQVQVFALSGCKTPGKWAVYTGSITFGKDSKPPQGLVRLARIQVEPDGHVHTAPPGN